MPDSIGCAPDDSIFVTIIRGLGRARMTRQAVQVLDLVARFGAKPSLKVLNSVLDVLVKDNIDLAREFYRNEMMGSGVGGDDYTHGILMKGLCLTNRIGEGFKLLQAIRSHGVAPNAVIYNTLIHALCRNGNVGRARSLMSEMTEPNAVTFNILISGYCGEDDFVQALVLLDDCLNLGLIPDLVTVTKVLEVLCNADRVSEAVQVLERVEGVGVAVDAVAYNTLIKGFCRTGKPRLGLGLMKKMEMKGCLSNVETYNLLISGFCDIGMLDSALNLFHDMKTDGVKWNFATYNLLIRGLCSAGRTQDGLKILEIMDENRRGTECHIGPYNSVIYGLYKEDRLNEALDFLYKIGGLFPKNADRSFRIMGFCKEGKIEDAKMVYDQMIEEGGNPSAIVYAHLIHGFCQKGCVQEAFEVMNEMVGCGYLPVASTLNVLISGFCQQGMVGNASKLLEDMIERGCFPDTTETYSPLVDALCRKGNFQEALTLFLQMCQPCLGIVLARTVLSRVHHWQLLIPEHGLSRQFWC